MTNLPQPSQSKMTSVTQNLSLLKNLNPILIFRNLFRNRQLIWNMIKRDIRSTYQGSFLGILWTIIFPLMMLVIYTFVFSVIFQAKWSGTDASKPTPMGEYAIILFAGLTPFTFFSTVISRAPGIVLSVPNYVKKVVFPLEILPVVISGSALFTGLISIGLILIGSLFIYQRIPISIWMLPFASLPLILFTLGLAWFLASLGVFIRDVGQSVGIILQILFFMTPIFYSADSVPDVLKGIIVLNPLSFIIDCFRQTLIWNKPIDWPAWGLVTFFSFIFAILGYAWFIATKKGFADVM